jgi:hypothetical protein
MNWLENLKSFVRSFSDPDERRYRRILFIEKAYISGNNSRISDQRFEEKHPSIYPRDIQQANPLDAFERYYTYHYIQYSESPILGKSKQDLLYLDGCRTAIAVQRGEELSLL